MQIFTVYDKKMETYKNLMEFKNQAVMARDLAEIANNPESTLFKHPTDYEVYKVGEFNQQNGILTTKEKPEFITNITDLMETKNVKTRN